MDRMKTPGIFCLTALALMLSVYSSLSDELATEDSSDARRRKPQYNYKSSYAVLPIPYSVPGLGSGIGVAVSLSDIRNTDLDTYLIIIAGDVEGVGIAADNYHLIHERLLLGFGYSYINKASFLINPSRGMEGSEDPDDFYAAEISDTEGFGFDATLTFYEKMLEFGVSHYTTSAKMDKIRDQDGNVILSTKDAGKDYVSVLGGEVLLDMTDDKRDPRSGLRVNLAGSLPLNAAEGGVESYVTDINTTAYIPVLKQSTLVLNYFHSDSHVINQGTTDRDEVASEYDVAVTSGTAEEERARDEFIDNVVAGNTYGSASSLGGLSRLRSYISMRYRGAHTRFAGAEFRWNLTDESTPFNIWLIKDIRTSFQIAFFHELGTTADHRSDLYDEVRQSTGVGFRMVLNSGLVFRFDVAGGDEGFQTAVFFDYPWNLF